MPITAHRAIQPNRLGCICPPEFSYSAGMLLRPGVYWNNHRQHLAAADRLGLNHYKETRMQKHLMNTLGLLVLVASLAATPALGQGQGRGDGAQRGGGGGGAGRGGRGGGGIVTLAVSSTSFPDGSEIPAKYTGQGTSPQLSWSGAPMGTASFVLIMH